MAPGECVAGAFLQVLFEGSGLLLVVEPDADTERPGSELGCMGADTGIVLGKALLDVGRCADISLIRVGF